MRTRAIGIIAAAALSVSLAGCTAPSTSGDQNTLELLQENGAIRAAFITAKPLAYVNEETGLLEGSGPTVLGAIMGELGIDTVDPILTEFDAIIPGLNANRWDMSAFPFFITPERCEQVAFTNPTARYTQGAIVAEGNPLNILSYEDLARPEIRIGVQSGNAEIDWAKDNGATDAQIKQFPDIALAIEALRNGQVDIYLNATFGLDTALEEFGGDGLEIADPFTGPLENGEEIVAYGAWAIRSGDTELRDAFNEVLAGLLASGELLELQAPFGYTPELMPEPDVTAASICPDADWAK